MNRASPVVTIGWLRQPPPLAGLLAHGTAAALGAIPLPFSGAGIWIEQPPASQTPFHSRNCTKSLPTTTFS